MIFHLRLIAMIFHRFRLNFTNIEEEKALVNDFGRTVLSAEKYCGKQNS